MAAFGLLWTDTVNMLPPELVFPMLVLPGKAERQSAHHPTPYVKSKSKTVLLCLVIPTQTLNTLSLFVVTSVNSLD